VTPPDEPVSAESVIAIRVAPRTLQVSSSSVTDSQPPTWQPNIGLSSYLNVTVADSSKHIVYVKNRSENNDENGVDAAQCLRDQVSGKESDPIRMNGKIVDPLLITIPSHKIQIKILTKLIDP
jgi:hypothetical protein